MSCRQVMRTGVGTGKVDRTCQREMDDAKEELESLEQLFNAGVETKDNVDRAKRRYEDAKYDYEDKKNKLERSRGTYETNLKERMAELELRKKELES